MLTERQTEILMVIHQHIQETGISPTYREMMDRLGVTSIGNMHENIRAIEERGFIRRMPGRSRAIEVLRLPGQDHRVREAAPLLLDALKGVMRLVKQSKGLGGYHLPDIAPWAEFPEIQKAMGAIAEAEGR